MSEKLHHHERDKSYEHFDIEKEVRSGLERAESSSETETELSSEHKAEQLASTVEQEAVSGKELTRDNPEKSSQHEHMFAAHTQLKEDAYSKLLASTRSQLAKPEKLFSSFVHRPSVEKISDVASKTVARPIGTTYGAIATFLGLSIALFFAYRYGFSFNYLLFVLLFVGGYVIATTVELLMKPIFRKKP